MSLYDRVRALATTVQAEHSAATLNPESVPFVTCARSIQGTLTSSLLTLLPPARARVSAKRDTRVRERPRWSDVASALFWLRHRGWLAINVAGVIIEGEPAWRAWVAQASTESLSAVRDRVADGGEPTPPPEPFAAETNAMAPPAQRMPTPKVSIAAQGAAASVADALRILGGFE